MELLSSQARDRVHRFIEDNPKEFAAIEAKRKSEHDGERTRLAAELARCGDQRENELAVAIEAHHAAEREAAGIVAALKTAQAKLLEKQQARFRVEATHDVAIDKLRRRMAEIAPTEIESLLTTLHLLHSAAIARTASGAYIERDAEGNSNLVTTTNAHLIAPLVKWSREMQVQIRENWPYQAKTADQISKDCADVIAEAKKRAEGILVGATIDAIGTGRFVI
jgi:hypothetical protein